MKKIFILMILCVFPNFILKAQFAGNTYICDQESFQLLKDLSNSSLKNGDIYVFTTTHQDLAWLNHIDACIADRDTLWLTPFLKRLGEDPTFKMDIEQTSILKEYIHRHPDTYPLFVKYMKEGRICVGGTFIQPPGATACFGFQTCQGRGSSAAAPDAGAPRHGCRSFR